MNGISTTGLTGQLSENITFVREVALRYRKPKRITSIDAVHSPDEAAEFMRRILPDNVREHFLVLFLNTGHHVVGYFVAASGTANSCQVGIREVFQAAVVAGAVAIVVGHNHTSGETIPSPEDRAVTRGLREAGALLGIPLLDHLIVGASRFYSFRESGQISA